ncbi:MAG: hypothetical protein K2Q18_17300 [Bdellovibrionales bacterium]|nr:hypothetical protein [Bdellovibrionales bacterium]
MKILIALTLFTATQAFAYTPKYQVEFDGDNVVSLVVENDSDKNLDCSYAISWVENVLTYKKFYGHFSFAPGEIFVLNKKNDPYSKLARLIGHVDCQ